MADIITFLIGLAVCIAVVVVLTILQMKMRKKADARKAARQQNPASAANDKFVVGRIYQMPDHSLAKYIGDNKFLKVKEK